jgi:2-polyprenyl-3-methyl-5-hydroxy-6-metoxy-1,4-benzoquinol methylase
MIKMESTANPNLGAQPDPIKSTVQFYEEHAQEYFERTVSADLSPIYDEFSKWVPPGSKVLDAGCGSGRDVKNLHLRGFDVMGIDGSAALVKLARQYSGANCRTMRLENINFVRRFDGIWSCASLLHVPKPKLISVLRRLGRAMVEGGTLYASVQVGKGEMLAPDGRYFAYFTTGEFTDYLIAAGLVVEKSWVSQDTIATQRSLRWINVFARES